MAATTTALSLPDTTSEPTELFKSPITEANVKLVLIHATVDQVIPKSKEINALAAEPAS